MLTGRATTRYKLETFSVQLVAKVRNGLEALAVACSRQALLLTVHRATLRKA